MTSSHSINISVGARSTPLSRAQVEEVFREIRLFYPEILFTPVWVTTKGDIDKITSLKTMDKTDFFTDEIDRRQAAGKFRISIHSAKDLPDPLHPELAIVAVTKGVDSADSLVVRKFPLRSGARIGISSDRREAFIKKRYPDVICIDIRGAIHERLTLLDEGIVDGIVVAEAALIRLNLTHRLRCRLDAETAEMQGRLAIIARKNDLEMKQIFQTIHDGDHLFGETK